MNAGVEMGTNEMEILQAISAKIADAVPEDPRAQRELYYETMDMLCGRFGNQTFSKDDMTHLFNFACRVPRVVCLNLGELHFALIPSSRLRCKAGNFGRVAECFPKRAHCKMALIVNLYLSSSGQPTLTGVMQWCANFKNDQFKELSENLEITKAAELFLRNVLKHYIVDETLSTKKGLLNARAKLYLRLSLIHI